MRRIQIGVMGSAADSIYSEQTELIAKIVGELIAEKNGILIYGAEKDYDSLSTVSARACKNCGGTTIGVTYGKGRNIWGENETDIIIATGLDRGGGREFVLVNSCDVIISISGGSGTLTEIAIAYQSDIPVVAIKGSGGWSDKLADTYLDSRLRRKVISSRSPREVVDIAFNEGEKYLKRQIKGD